MTFEQNSLHLVLSLLFFCFAACAALSILWLCKGKSVFSHDTSFRGHVSAALSSFFSKTPRDLGNKTLEYRCHWAMRLLAPWIAPTVLVALLFTPIFQVTGYGAHTLQTIFVTGAAGLLGYCGFMMVFVQRVVCNAHHVQSHGLSLRGQTRRLDGLAAVRVSETVPVIVLTFSNQPTLYIPKYTMHRDTLIRDLQEIADHNGNNGRVAPIPTWQARMELA